MDRDDGQVLERPPARRERNRFTRVALGALIGVALVGLGIAAGVWAERRMSGRGAQSAGVPSMRAPAEAPSPAAPSAASSLPAPPDASADVEVVLTPEGVARAGLKTATVRAVTDVALLGIDREPFIAALTGQPRSRTMATELAARRLADDRTRA